MSEEAVKKNAKSLLNNMLDSDYVRNQGQKIQIRQVVGVRIEMLFLDEKGERKVFGMGHGDIELS